MARQGPCRYTFIGRWLLSRFAPRAGLVTLRQTFVRRSHAWLRKLPPSGSGEPPTQLVGASGSVTGRHRSTSRSPSHPKTSVRASGGPRRRWLALGQSSVQFRWLVVLAVSPGRCVEARLQARKAGVGLRSKIRKYLAVASFDLGENFIDAREHAPDNLDHLAPQDVEFAAQPLDVALAPFTAHRTSSQNCSNSARNSNGGPQEPSDSTGVAV